MRPQPTPEQKAELLRARAELVSAWGKFLTGAGVLLSGGGAAWAAASGYLTPVLQSMGFGP